MTAHSDIVTRFAPSPTGFLHIGGARTALFNWLFAQRHRGRYLLRIEDTDRVRSTEAAVAAILDGLSWLGLTWDADAVFQHRRIEAHKAAALALLDAGKAYKCYATPEELAEMREKARAEGRPVRYDGRWRDRDPSDAPPGAPAAVRLKAPRDGETVVEDLVQGQVSVANQQLDDMVLLRSDGTPTYMLAVVVDDHDMGITHVIRGDDHLTNMFRQIQLFRALGWDVPEFGHIPLIYGQDGAKLSKRHGALGVDTYRDMGYLPEALCNYLLRLGWGHGDEDVIDRARAVELFDLSRVGRAPSRFDKSKLDSLNGHYIRRADDRRLAEAVSVALADTIGYSLTETARIRIAAAIPLLKERAKTLLELAESAEFLVRSTPLPFSEKARRLVEGDGSSMLSKIRNRLAAIATESDWIVDTIKSELNDLAAQSGVGMGAVAMPLRAALTGSTASPDIFAVAAILGRKECLARLNAHLG